MSYSVQKPTQLSWHLQELAKTFLNALLINSILNRIILAPTVVWAVKLATAHTTVPNVMHHNLYLTLMMAIALTSAN